MVCIFNVLHNFQCFGPFLYRRVRTIELKNFRLGIQYKDVIMTERGSSKRNLSPALKKERKRKISWYMIHIREPSSAEHLKNKTYLFHLNNMLSFANKQPRNVLLSLHMFKTRRNSTFLRYNTWFKIREELFSFMALYFTILNSTPTKSCIQFDGLDGCSTSFILFKQSWDGHLTVVARHPMDVTSI